MSKYRCEHCDELIEISPLHAPAVLSKRQRLAPHPDKKTGKPCPGSEKQV